MTPVALKIALAVAIIAGACGATWFGASAHYSAKYEALKAEVTQAAKDQQKDEDEKVARDTTVSKEVNDAANLQIGAMGNTISDLLLRHAGATIVRSQVCPAGTAATSADGKANGSGATTSDRQAPIDSGQIVSIDAATEIDALTIGIDSLKAQQLWRKFARETAN